MEKQGAALAAEQMRKAIARVVEGLNAGDPRELAGELFRDDGELTAAVIDAVPRLVSAAAEAAKAFAESLAAMPADKAAELVSRAYARIDGSEIGEVLNSFSRLIIRLHEHNPQLFSSGRTGLVSEALSTADFGKLRKAVTYRMGERLELLRSEVELLGDNPVALVNLFSVVAPLVNDALRVLKAVTDILALPAEAMTYALFKILEEVGWRDLAAVLNGVAAIIVTLHRGSYILGDGSLYTKGPFARISSELLAGLDGQALAEALAGLGEEAEAFLTAFAGLVIDDAAVAVPLAEAAVSLANSSFRAAADTLERFAAAPAETAAGAARALAEDLEAAELARALNALAAACRRLLSENPALARKWSQDMLSGLELELSPEAAAAGFNRALAAFNRWAGSNPDQVAKGAGAFLAGIDAGGLERAAKTASGQLAEALSRNPAVLKPLLKAVISVLYGGARGYVKGLRGRIKARGG